MKKKIFGLGLLSFCLLLFSGCNKTDDTTKKETLNNGVFMSKISGVEYNCLPSKTNSLTDDNGVFKYKDGDSCTFSIGSLLIGQAEGNSLITPKALFSLESFDNKNLFQTTQLLISLDNDSNISNGIKIDDFVGDQLTDEMNITELDNDGLTNQLLSIYPNRTLANNENTSRYLTNMINQIKDITTTFTITRKMIADKKIEFTNMKGESFLAIFNADGNYSDSTLSCKPTWSINSSDIVIDKSNCVDSEANPLLFRFYEEPANAALATIIDNNISIGTKITEVIPITTPLLTSTNTNDWLTDRDYKHITFVNQTSKKVCIYANLKSGTIWHGDPDHSIQLGSYEAKYLLVGNDWDENDHIFVDFDNANESCDTWKKEESFDKKYTNKFLKKKDVVYIRNGSLFHDIDVTRDKSGCDQNSSKPAILFAHGLHSKQSSWGNFAKHAKAEGWRVFRTSVSANGSVKKRAQMLNTYIKGIAKECKIGQNQLRVVGHSMGGLDLRYILSSNGSDYEDAQNIIERAYTMATPHRGSGFGSVGSFKDDGIKSCSIKNMKGFNNDRPYSRIQNHNKTMLAIRFHCNNDIDISDSEVGELKGVNRPADGVVKVRRQIFKDLPYAKTLYKGTHTSDSILLYGHCSDCTEEQKQTRILDIILNDYNGENISHYRNY